MSNLSINEIVGYQVESTAEWRRQKAEQFPDDHSVHPAKPMAILSRPT